MSSDCTTARRAGDQHRSVDDVSFCAISETGTQSAARYRGAVPMRQRRVKMMTSYLMRAQLARQANGDRHASAKVELPLVPVRMRDTELQYTP